MYENREGDAGKTCLSSFYRKNNIIDTPCLSLPISCQFTGIKRHKRHKNLKTNFGKKEKKILLFCYRSCRFLCLLLS